MCEMQYTKNEWNAHRVKVGVYFAHACLDIFVFGRNLRSKLALSVEQKIKKLALDLG